jgi:predicted RNA-binding protein with PIN domain
VLYLFDGWNLLHAGGYRSADELVDRLAGFVAAEGARGVVVFDGAGADRTVGALEVRHAEEADAVLERLAVDARDRREEVVLVSSDRLIRETAGQEVRRRTSNDFAAELAGSTSAPGQGIPEGRVEDALDPDTRSKLEQWRRRRA